MKRISQIIIYLAPPMDDDEPLLYRVWEYAKPGAISSICMEGNTIMLTHFQGPDEDIILNQDYISRIHIIYHATNDH